MDFHTHRGEYALFEPLSRFMNGLNSSNFSIVFAIVLDSVTSGSSALIAL